MKRAVIPVLLLAAGCTPMSRPGTASAVPPPEVARPCVDAAKIPPEPPMVGQKFNGDAKHDLQVLAPNARALREWGQKLDALLRGCAGERPKPAATAPAKTG